MNLTATAFRAGLTVTLTILMALMGPASAQRVRITRVVPAPKRYVAHPQVAFAGDSLNPIVLTYTQNNLFIYFEGAASGEKYVYSLPNLFRYGIATTDNFAFFSNVPSGEYTFTVRRASDPPGHGATQKIILEAPVWLRWWFLPVLFVYVLIFISVVIYFGLRYRYREQLRLIQLREHVARDLHDDMGSQLSSISILSRNVETMVSQNPELARQSIMRIGETARQVMDTMGDIVWSVNPDNDSLPRIVERMKNFAGELFDLSDTEITFLVSEEVAKVSLAPQSRRDFYLIYKEALTNAARYANARTVQVVLEHHMQTLQLTVQDDGRGFDLTQPPTSRGGNGLKNMQSRAAKIRGKFTIDSLSGRGTSIILVLPLL